LVALLDAVVRNLQRHHVLVVALVSLAEGFMMVQLERAMLQPSLNGVHRSRRSLPVVFYINLKRTGTWQASLRKFEQRAFHWFVTWYGLSAIFT
jgi:hypothetical protein